MSTTYDQDLKDRADRINELHRSLTVHRADYKSAVRKADAFLRDVGYPHGVRRYLQDQAEGTRIRLRGVKVQHDVNGSIIYFIQQKTGSGPVKIGRARNVFRRLESLQAGSPVQLVILTTMPGGSVREAELHRQFAHLRLHGEWFQDSPELMEFINGIDCPE